MNDLTSALYLGDRERPVEVHVSWDHEPLVPAQVCGPVEGCYPAEGGYVHDVDITARIGPSDGALLNWVELTAADCDEIGGEHDLSDDALWERADADYDGPDPDRAYDEWRDRRMEGER